MSGRTFAIGDIHGDLEHLEILLGHLPPLERDDTLVFVGDYVDRGPRSAQVIEYLRRLPGRTPAKVVALRGSHEDAWLQVRREGWWEFVMPVGNGCLATLRSFVGGPAPERNESPTAPELTSLLGGSFLPDDVVAWMESLPCWYEDEHAIYVHAGLPQADGRWLHPSEAADPKPLLWQRTEEFFTRYRGKRVVFGHTVVEELPQGLSLYTPEDATDLFYGECVIGIDTCCGHGGFLTAIELPGLVVYESRRRLA
jgi:serine/threonine protein phosphatase 1